jgi:hypothetical protein
MTSDFLSLKVKRPRVSKKTVEESEEEEIASFIQASPSTTVPLPDSPIVFDNPVESPETVEKPPMDLTPGMPFNFSFPFIFKTVSYPFNRLSVDYHSPFSRRPDCSYYGMSSLFTCTWDGFYFDRVPEGSCYFGEATHPPY